MNHTMAILQLSIENLKHNSQLDAVQLLFTSNDVMHCTEVPEC